MPHGLMVPGMATDEDVNTTRTSVKAYLPAYQKSQWKTHAEELGMTQSEFVRSMVQAGRRGFGASGEVETVPNADESKSPEPAASGSDELADRVVTLLDREGTLSWDALVEALTDDIEERLDDTMAELQDQRKVRYSGRHGGYTLSEDE